MTTPLVALERFAYTPMGTFGRLSVEGFECFSLEDPDNDNRAGESCIPCGTYDLALGRYHRGNYDAYEVANVPDRSLIKIHAANTHHDLRGCIAPGERLGFLRESWAVLSSRSALAGFMEAMGESRDGILQVTSYTPTQGVMGG